jgi:photosystem II stability/assembly factor-like uncharacterized protein
MKCRPAVVLLRSSTVLAFAGLHFFGCIALAGVGRWTSIGPPSSSVTYLDALAIDPRASATLYAAAGYSLFKTTDGGMSWFSLEGVNALGLAVDPATSAVYVGSGALGGLYRSEDGGQSWSNAGGSGDDGITENVTNVAIDPVTPGTLYVCTFKGIFKTVNGGATWSNLGGPGLLRILAIDSTAPSTLYASGIAPAPPLHKSTDGGENWVSIVEGLPLGAFVNHLMIARGSPQTLFALANGDVYFSTNGGTSWAVRSAGLGFSTLAGDPVTPTTLYAGTYDGQGAFKSIDGGSTWSAIGSGLEGRLVKTLLIDPSTPSTVYGGVEPAFEPGGNSNPLVYKTWNAGARWSASGTGLTAISVVALAANFVSPTRLYLGSGDGSLFRTDDAGASWTLLPRLEARSLAVDPTSSSIVYAGTWQGVYKSTDAGITWNVSLAEEFGSLESVVAIDPSSPSTIYAGKSGGNCCGGKVFKSMNGGVTWVQLNTGPLSVVTAIAVDPVSSSTVYVTARLDDLLGGLRGVFKSVDGGATWSELTSGLPSVRNITAFALDPALTSTLYVALSGDGVYKSVDGGASWSPAGQGLVGDVIALALESTNPPSLYAGTEEDGVFRSVDGGATWTRLNSGLSERRVQKLAAPGGSPTVIYAGTPHGGFQFGLGTGPCESGPTTLCLGGDRFRLEVFWRAANLGTSGIGQAVPLTADTGYFWFFQPTNVELVIKVLDARSFSGHFWVFYGALSNVEYTIIVTDTETGEQKTYFNPQNNLASVADTAAFPLGGSAVSAPMDRNGEAFLREKTAFTGLLSRTLRQTEAAKAACTPSGTALCLSGNRFRLVVAWRAVHLGTSGVGQAVPLTSDTGYFWFFQNTNVELIIKVLDARAFSGHFWVFYGALSNVEYTITVTDTETNQVKIYFNPQDTLASVADTAAF